LPGVRDEQQGIPIKTDVRSIQVKGRVIDDAGKSPDLGLTEGLADPETTQDGECEK
jgi:hypothetical protein